MKFILFKNEKYADELGRKIGAIVRKSELEIRTVSPRDDDVFIIDAHYGNNMNDLHGIKIAEDIRNYCVRRNLNIQIKILSWFKENSEIIQKNYNHLSGKENIEFIQLPISNFST